MKLCTFLLLSFVALTPLGELQAQIKERVELEYKKAPVIDVLLDISSQMDVVLRWNVHLLKNPEPVTISMSGNYRKALRICCRKQVFFVELDSGRLLMKERNIEVRGKVLNSRDEPVPGVTVTISGTKDSATTDANGHFRFASIPATSKLLFRSMDIDSMTVELNGRPRLTVRVYQKVAEGLQAVEVFGYTGQQQIPSRSLVSWPVKIPEESRSTRPSPSLTTQLQGATPGFLAVRNKVAGVNQPDEFSIVPTTTINANRNALLVVDNFPFSGKISDINPDDVETVTILKDASGASAWGARAGNGVVVISTNQPKYGKPFGLSFNTWYMMSGRPDLHNERLASAKGQLEIYQYLHDNNFYRFQERAPWHPALPLPVEAMIAFREGKISEEEKNRQLEMLGNRDIRSEKEKYFMQDNGSSSFSLQMGSGSRTLAWLFSGSYFKSRTELQDGDLQRATASLFNKYKLHNDIELSAGISHISINSHNTDGLPRIPSPNVQLADASGQPQAYPIDLRQSYTDTAGGGNLYDWRYYPLREFQLRDRSTLEKNTRVTGGINYTPGKGFEARLLYQQQWLQKEVRNLENKEGYFVRHLVNQFTQGSGSLFERPIPYGHILDHAQEKITVQNFRAMAGYTTTWKEVNSFKIFAGYDRIKMLNQVASERIYNYSADRPGGQNDLDFQTFFPLFNDPFNARRIPAISSIPRRREENFISYYADANLRLSRYDLSGSVRWDRSNLFGSDIRDRAIPLLTAGIGWNISTEQFYGANWLPELKLHLTYGSNGNVPVGVASVSTIIRLGLNPNGDPMNAINNPPLHSLRWERVNTLNFGIKFGALNKRIQGTIDLFRRHAKDLIGLTQVDYTTGTYSMTGNQAAIKSYNADVMLNIETMRKPLEWRTTLLFSFVNEMVTEYEDTLHPAWTYPDAKTLSVAKGKPLYPVFSFPYLGLDQFGNPYGKSNGIKSQEYNSILTTTGYNTLIYHGRSTPAIFGIITNDLNWNSFTLSVSLQYKFKYFFRRQSVNYDAIFREEEMALADVENRWRNPGDERFTNVPGFPDLMQNYVDRDKFYNLSEVLVEKGDHIRLENIYMSYDLGKKILDKIKLKSGRFYFNVNNIGIIWRMNKYKIDPDYLTDYIPPRTFCIGFKGAL